MPDTMTPAQETAAEQARRERQLALELAAEALRRAEAAAEAARARIGEIMRRDAAEPRQYRIGGPRAAEIVGVQRSTILDWRDNRAPEWGQLQDLAQRALGGDEDAEDELQRRIPWLATWSIAVRHVSRRAFDRAHGGQYDPLAPLPDEPAMDDLREVYERALVQLAAGEVGPTPPAPEDI